MWGTDQRVLVVDDDPGCRELLRHWLAGKYTVDAVESGEHALEAVDETVDVVLLDREMPGLTGAEVFEQLRQRGYEGYVVMVSGVKPDVDMVSSVDDYLVKPVSEGELRSVVDRLTTRAQYHDHLRELFTLATKKARFELQNDPLELAKSKEYTRVVQQVAQQQAVVRTAIAEAEDQWQAALEACQSERSTSSAV